MILSVRNADVLYRALDRVALESSVVTLNFLYNGSIVLMQFTMRLSLRSQFV